MGTISSIACTECKVTRDLDKIYSVHSVATIPEAVSLESRIKESPYRVALMVSFMAEHKGHKCVFFDEHSDCEELYEPYYDENDYAEEKIDWYDQAFHKEHDDKIRALRENIQ